MDNMRMKLDYIVVVLVTLVLITFVLYLLNSVFANNFNNNVHKYDAQFDAIASNFRQAQYQETIRLANRIVADEEVGMNHMKAKCYIGLSYLNSGNAVESKAVLESLVHTYPEIEMVYRNSLNLNEEQNLIRVYNHILTDYIPGYNSAVSKKMTLSDIFDNMNGRRWAGLIFVLTGSIVIYERFIRKWIVPGADE